MELVSTAEQELDLIAAMGVDGTSGYLKKDDMFGDQPNNPEEAIAYMKRLEKEKARGPKFLPLYASDGRLLLASLKFGKYL